MTAIITIEEECFVFDDRPADPSAICVPHQRGARNLGVRMIVEPIVRGEAPASIDFKSCPMPAIRTRLANQIHLGAGRATLVRICVGCGDAELFDSLRIQPKNRTRRDVASISIQLADYQAIGG